ncbi:uncharacterized protein MELLADRAFT_48554 [Melampsora larici-populina 98AG31]|uniref:Electron transfer flavoprotein-ubiquinone oxidoreductase n=1 Tax=Melampsora larici-populina (strain 98AG31 / pathotype 3-4-7) TaxID=747676 RepID=F4RNF5_MELLP|nr:uncharacterized protein MELLADRAFT_48554 [Melampsora larici-populina 98AG31]EGG05979.1 hypothetical protein MELLADRAFT_48554 [Melampsora larici-populina 98AG31]
MALLRGRVIQAHQSILSRSLRCRSIPPASLKHSTSSFSTSVFLTTRAFSSTTINQSKPTPINSKDESKFDLNTIERVSDEVDVCIVGGGPAGLSAAIKLKQIANSQNKPDFRVIVLEKGSEIGSHILSGAVIETKALDELLPNWKETGAPLNQLASSDSMKFLTKSMAFPIPHPPQMNNHGNYIISLSKLCRWLSEQAEELGVEIYSGFAGSELIYDDDHQSIKGVITNEIGLDRHRQPKESFEAGMKFYSKITLLAEGCHGSLTKKVIQQFDLRKDKDPQTYGLGIKEVWKIQDDVYEPGKVVHTLGWPLKKDTYGGSWLYHMEDNMISIGMVVGLDYPNPTLSPYQEFQRLKHHPFFSRILKGAECIAYGARALNEGGYQSIPKLNFPGGALIGCSAGFLNVPKIKGTHTAMKSGMLAAQATFDAIQTQSASESNQPIDLIEYPKLLEESWVMKELKQVRNLRPSFHTSLGLYGGILYSGLDSFLLKGRVPWTFHHPKEDYASTKKISEVVPIEYPSPDHQISFDILTSVSRTGTNHAENQPVHLVVKDGKFKEHTQVNVQDYDGLLNKACPAGVYEYVDVDVDGQISGGDDQQVDGKRLVINSQNCIHCKTCDIKVPTQDINWTVPEGGGGPAYSLT